MLSLEIATRLFSRAPMLRTQAARSTARRMPNRFQRGRILSRSVRSASPLRPTIGRGGYSSRTHRSGERTGLSSCSTTCSLHTRSGSSSRAATAKTRSRSIPSRTRAAHTARSSASPCTTRSTRRCAPVSALGVPPPPSPLGQQRVTVGSPLAGADTDTCCTVLPVARVQACRACGKNHCAEVRPPSATRRMQRTAYRLARARPCRPAHNNGRAAACRVKARAPVRRLDPHDRARGRGAVRCAAGRRRGPDAHVLGRARARDGQGADGELKSG